MFALSQPVGELVALCFARFPDEVEQDHGFGVVQGFDDIGEFGVFGGAVGVGDIPERGCFGRRCLGIKLFQVGQGEESGNVFDAAIFVPSP